MKKIPSNIVTSVVTALLTTLLCMWLLAPKLGIDTTNSGAAKFVAFNDMLLSGKMQRTFLSSAPTNFITAAEGSTPLVVNIRAMDSELFSSAGSGSTGSGVVVSPDGYIVTNNHVVEGASDIQVTMHDKQIYADVKVIGTDPSTDLALIKITPKNTLPFITFGNSDSVRIGEWVLAVGNPFNLESTVTAGIVSAKARNINILEDKYSIESFIQTDAAVNPGNSGGALINTNGELIGINAAIMTQSGRYEGYSFAIPSNLVRKVVNDLREFGIVQRGFLGISISDLDSDRSDKLGVSAAAGVYVDKVFSSGGANEAGIKVGDIIVGINGMNIKSKPELLEQVGLYRPGNTVSIEYVRGNKRFKADIVLKNKNNTTSLLDTKSDAILSKVGFELRELSAEERRKVETSGVKVLSITQNSLISRTNMDPGFVITHINNNRVTTIDEVITELEKSNGKDKVVLQGVYLNYAGEYYYKFPMK